jgi:hypothetical protein
MTEAATPVNESPVDEVPPPEPRPVADRPRVVVVGGGFGGLAAVRGLAKTAERQPLHVTLIDRRNHHTFQPLLYQVATSGLNPADVGYPVRGLFHKQRNIRFHKGQVVGADWERRHLALADGRTLPFDDLIVAAGATTSWFGVPGAERYGFPLYTLDDAVRLRNHIVERFEAADADASEIERGALTFVVVGGGPTGVETAGALAELVHAGDGLRQHLTPFGTALMGLAGRAEGLAAQLRGDLLGADHHFGTADDLLRRAQLRLQPGRQLLDRIGHARSRQRVMAGGVGKVAGQLADGIGGFGRGNAGGAMCQAR